ncbi:FUSC family protein [Nonomuraea zeae]|uniref:FUSC family protein n=1 Tax=Nonomuraea zeae TaxID=1642303 RepID=A0A5S4GTF3_9ACTN|nr:FUSC family protein [Nonomuraea zeae]TMR36215.1 FUSC family protein [Nonomuraea zeae]
MPVRAALRLSPLGDIWHKPALSAVAALALVLLPLYLAGRLDLVLYAAAGSMCALYGHGLPYATRAKALAWVTLGMLSGTGVALVTAALTDSIAVRVAVAAILAGLHKAVCDATRIGPPGNVVLTFIAASAAFVPQHLADVPMHLGVGVLGGVVAWAVGMAPGLIRPDGPERIAVARALEAAARLLRTRAENDRAAVRVEAGSDLHQARQAAAAAVNAAWQTLLRSGAADRRQGLRRLLVRGETAVALVSAERPRVPAAELVADADRLAAFARELRKGRRLPEPSNVDPQTAAAEQAELAGITAEERAPARRAIRRPLLDIARRWRTVLTVSGGAAVAGWASMALGVGRPYWAVVTAAAVFAANTTLSWNRALQRVVGNLLGVALFTLLVPVTRLGALALIGTVLVMQFVTEAAVTRNYWLGSVFVTTMAILMTEFAGAQPVPALVADRWLDTCVGAAAGLLACALLPDRRAAQRVRDGLDRLESAVAQEGSPPAGRDAARGRLRAALVELREAADVAAGEWWSAALPHERIAAAERAGHHRLAELAT